MCGDVADRGAFQPKRPYREHRYRTRHGERLEYRHGAAFLSVDCFQDADQDERDKERWDAEGDTRSTDADASYAGPNR